MEVPTFTHQDYGIKLDLPQDPVQRANLIRFFDAMAAEHQANVEREFRAAINFKPREREVKCQPTSQ